MYIANTTKQHHRFNFRVPEKTRVHVLDIPSGQQVEVGNDWNSVQADNVIRQLEFYGARNVAEAAGKLKGYAGLLYSTGKPVNVDKILAGHEVVVDEQAKRSVDELTKTALGFDASLREKGTRKRTARSTTMQIAEDIPRNTKPSGNEVKFGLTVTPEGHDEPKVD